MRIGLNLLHARPQIGGGWNYIANVVKALRFVDEECEFIAYCTPASAEMVPDNPRFRTKMVRGISVSQVARVAYEQSILPTLAKSDGLDCVHWFANNRSVLDTVPAVVTVHDFKFIDRPSEEAWVKELYLRRMARFACRRANSLIAVSNATAKAASRLFGVDEQKIFVIPNPIEDTFRPEPEQSVKQFCDRLKLPTEFWVYVAHPYAHKNHAKLFRAYKKFKESSQSGWALVLRGDSANGNAELDALAIELGIADSIRWLPRLSTEDMARLYSASSAMIFPSLYEGGGIPVLEAMACGCPVVASNIDTTREFAGDAALTFDPTDVDAIAATMLRFVSDRRLRESCVRRGLIKATKYSANHIAGRLLSAYRNAISRQLAPEQDKLCSGSVVRGTSR